MSGVGIVVMMSLVVSAVGGSARESHWSYGPAAVEARAVGGWEWVSVKDPSVVRYGDRWHLFCTVRGADAVLMQSCI